MDTEFTRNIICPHCGCEDVDSWEVNLNDIEFVDYGRDCSECGKHYVCERHCETTYSSFKNC